MRNCVLHDSGQGLVVASTGTGAARRITVTGNHFHTNGSVGSALEHNASAEAIGITYEGNRFGAAAGGRARTRPVRPQRGARRPRQLDRGRRA